MRHRNKKGRLNRTISHRKATLKNLAISLIKHQRIETTLMKAKALKVFVEPIITLAKKDIDSVAAKRLVFKKLANKEAVKILFKEIAPLFVKVKGGYTRIMQFGPRKGDGAPKAIIELTKRTISEEDLIKAPKAEEKAKKKKKSGKKAGERENVEPKKDKKQDVQGKEVSGGEGAKEGHHRAPDISKEKKEEHLVEDVRKEKARSEQKKIFQKGIFKRFRRKSI